MLFWLLVIALTAVACAALYYASARQAVKLPDGTEAVTAHLRAQLSEIEDDRRTGRLDENEAMAARAEVAREAVRLEGNGAGTGPAAGRARETAMLPLALLLVAVLAIGTYSTIGAPEIPAQPLLARADLPPAQTDPRLLVAEANAAIRAAPDDPAVLTEAAYTLTSAGDFDGAIKALRHTLQVSPPTADVETDLAEAIMLKQGGAVAGEPLTLLQSAASRDPQHVRSHFWLAAEATRAGNFDDAANRWRELIGWAKGDEAWLPIARNGLKTAEAGPVETPTPPQDVTQNQQIADMVEGLSQRLASDGGSIEEWTQLVRSRVVLGQLDLAQQAYDAARAAYPDAAGRADLDSLANAAGLK